MPPHPTSPQSPQGDLAGIDVDLEYMFAAGKKHIPDKADRLSGIAHHLYYHLQALNEQAALAGDPKVLTTLLQVGGMTYDALGVGVQSLNNAAQAVLATAQDFVETDADARKDFEQMNGTLGGIDLRDVPAAPAAPQPPDLPDPSLPGAPGTDDDPGGHPSNGATPSTPEPASPDEVAPDRDDNQQQSEDDHPYVPEDG